jgi:hypothetical protein
MSWGYHFGTCPFWRWRAVRAATVGTRSARPGMLLPFRRVYFMARDALWRAMHAATNIWACRYSVMDVR